MSIGDIRLSAYGESLMEAHRRQKLQEGLDEDKKAQQVQNAPKSRKNSVSFGCKPVLTAAQQWEIVRLNKEQNLSLKKLADQFCVSRATIYRALKEDLRTSPTGVAHETAPIYNSYG